MHFLNIRDIILVGDDIIIGDDIIMLLS